MKVILITLALIFTLSGASRHLQGADGDSMDYYRRAVKKQAKMDLNGALADFDKAIALDPKNAMAYSARGLFRLSFKSDRTGMMADLRRSVELAPDSEEIRFVRGHLFCGFAVGGDGQFRQIAIDDLDKVLDINPNNVAALQDRARIRSSLKWDVSDPSSPTSPTKEELDGALADLNKAVTLDPKGALAQRADFKADRQDYAGAIADFTEAIKYDPGDAYLYRCRAWIHEAQGDIDAAIADNDLAMECFKKNPDNANEYCPYYAFRAGLKKHKGDYKGALQDYALAIQSFKRASSELNGSFLTGLYYERGMLCYTTGDLQGAFVDFQNFASRPITSPTRGFGLEGPDQIQFKLWIIRTKLGRKAEADKELESYLDKRTGKPSIYNNNGNDPYVSDFAADANYLLGRISEGEFKKDNSQGWFLYGVKHLLAGDKKTAFDYLFKCVPPSSNTQPGKSTPEQAILLEFPELKALMN